MSLSFRAARRVSASVLAMALLAAMPRVGRADGDPVLQAIPGDAQFVVVVKNLNALQTKLNNLSMQLHQPAPQDLVGMIGQRFGLTQGVDAAGSAAFVKVGLPAPKEGEDNTTKPVPYVLLVPTTDSALLLKDFSPKDAGEGISTVTLPNEADSGYVAVSESKKFVAFAQSKESLVSFLNGIKAGTFNNTLRKDASDAFFRNDVVAFVNAAAMSKELLPVIDEGAQTAKGLLEMSAAQQDPEKIELTKAMIDVYLGQIKSALKDAETAAVTLRLEDPGITLGMAAHFKSTSRLGLLAKNSAALTAPDFSLLPSGDILAAGSVALDPESLKVFAKDLAFQVLAVDAIAHSEKIEEYTKLANSAVDMLGSTSSMKFVLLAPKDATRGYVRGAELIETKDPEKLLAMITKAVKDQSKTQMNPDVKTTVTLKPAAKNVEGIEMSQVLITYSAPDGVAEADVKPQTKQALQVINKMLGGNTFTEYYGKVSGKVLVVFGSDPVLLDSAVTAVLSKEPGLSQNAEIGAGKLVAIPNAGMVTYLPLLRFVSMAKAAMNPNAPQAVGAPAAGAAGAVATPLVISAKPDDNGYLMEIHLPRQTLVSLGDEYRAAAGRRGGGVAPGDNGPGEQQR